MSKNKKNKKKSTQMSKPVSAPAAPPVEFVTKSRSKIIEYDVCSMPHLWLQVNEAYSNPQKGELLRNVLDILKYAQKKVILSSFLLADTDVENAMKEAADRGVRVYVLLASEKKLEKFPRKDDEDDDFAKRTRDELIGTLNRLAGKVLFRSAEFIHAKCVISDWDNSEAKQGILLTSNLCMEGLVRNEELGIVLKKSEINRLMEYLKWAFWEAAEHEYIEEKGKYKFEEVKSLSCVAHPTLRKESAILATTQKTTELKDASIELIQNAHSSLIAACYGWEENHPLIQNLIQKAQEGLSVTILARIRDISMPAFIKLAEAGAVIYGFQYLHAKSIIADYREGLVMTANFEKKGMDEGFEIGIRLRHGDERLNAVVNQLGQWQMDAPWKFCLNKLRKDFQTDEKILPYLDDHLPLHEKSKNVQFDKPIILKETDERSIKNTIQLKSLEEERELLEKSEEFKKAQEDLKKLPIAQMVEWKYQVRFPVLRKDNPEAVKVVDEGKIDSEKGSDKS